MRLRSLAVGFLMLATTCGCTSMRPISWEDQLESDPGTKGSEAWVGSAGEIARTVHAPDSEPDPLGLRKYFTSEKAREIERNVGVGE